MIKGINRQIIEITDTGNIYYEKAYLFVRPEYKDCQEALLKKQAQKMLSGIKAPSALKRPKLFFYWAIRFLAFSAIGSITTAIIFNLYY